MVWQTISQAGRLCATLAFIAAISVQAFLDGIHVPRRPRTVLPLESGTTVAEPGSQIVGSQPSLAHVGPGFLAPGTAASHSPLAESRPSSPYAASGASRGGPTIPVLDINSGRSSPRLNTLTSPIRADHANTVLTQPPGRKDKRPARSASPPASSWFKLAAPLTFRGGPSTGATASKGSAISASATSAETSGVGVDGVSGKRRRRRRGGQETNVSEWQDHRLQLDRIRTNAYYQRVKEKCAAGDPAAAARIASRMAYHAKDAQTRELWIGRLLDSRRRLAESEGREMTAEELTQFPAWFQDSKEKRKEYRTTKRRAAETPEERAERDAAAKERHAAMSNHARNARVARAKAGDPDLADWYERLKAKARETMQRSKARKAQALRSGARGLTDGGGPSQPTGSGLSGPAAEVGGGTQR